MVRVKRIYIRIGEIKEYFKDRRKKDRRREREKERERERVVVREKYIIGVSKMVNNYWRTEI